jgi:hypothetical protein
MVKVVEAAGLRDRDVSVENVSAQQVGDHDAAIAPTASAIT